MSISLCSVSFIDLDWFNIICFTTLSDIRVYKSILSCIYFIGSILYFTTLADTRVSLSLCSMSFNISIIYIYI